MANFTQTLRALNAAADRQAAGEALNACVGAPTLMTLQQFADVVIDRGLAGMAADHVQAIRRCRAFGAETGGTRFIHLQRTRIAMQLMARVLHSALINQGTFGMCGPAAWAIDTARHNPREYVDFAVALANNGTGSIGARVITPVDGILRYQLSERPREGMPQADWVVLACLRNDPDSLEGNFSKESYGGASGDELFTWLVDCGFQKVVLMSHLTLANSFRCHPEGLLPPNLASSDKLRTLRTAADMLKRGWRIFMQGFMQLSRSVEAMTEANKMHHLAGASPGANAQLQTMQQREAAKLAVANPGVLGTIWGTAKSLAGFSGGDTRHWTYVEALEITVDDRVIITCCNHGVHFPSVALPIDGFLNKFLGFLAASDYA
jgi:hypothetical protein